MLAYNMKDILLIVPEAESMTKEASLNEDFPIDSRDSAIASALRIEYLTKVAGETITYPTREKVASALEAFSATTAASGLVQKIAKFAVAEKRASLYDATESLHLQEEVLRGNLGFHQDLMKVASYAEDIVSRFNGQEFSHETQLYSGALPFGEHEVTNALQKRAYATGDTRYNDVLGVVSDYTVECLNLGGQEKRASVAKTVTQLDQEHFYNGDFFREAFVKEASYYVNLGGKSVPWEKIDKDHVGDVLGKEVSAALTGDYANDKAVLESLPMDEKATLGRFL